MLLAFKLVILVFIQTIILTTGYDANNIQFQQQQSANLNSIRSPLEVNKRIREIDNSISTVPYEYVDCGTFSTNAIRFSLKNPQHPEPNYGKVICETVIEHSSSKIKTLKLHLKQLNLYRSMASGECHHDKFAVFTDLNHAVSPVMCGNKTGETIMIPFDSSRKYLILSVITSNLDHDRQWVIEAEQLES